MRSRAGYTPFIILAPPAILTVIIIFWVTAQVRHTWAHLPQILEAQLTAALGREVRIGKLAGDFWNGIELRDVAVARSGKLSGGALVRVARARVRYSLDAVLYRGAPPLESIQRIELERPWIYVSRDRKGRINLQDLVKPGKPPKKGKPQRFLATVAIRGGTILFEDHYIRGGPITHHLTDIDLDLDGRASPLYVASLRANGDKGRVTRIEVDASVDPERQAYSVLADLRGVHIKPWMAYVPSGVKLPVKPEAGVVDARLSALVEKGRLVDYRGQVKVRDAALRVPQIAQPVSDFDGTFQVTPDVATADDVSIAAGKIRLAGTATVTDFKKPWVRAHLAATGIREADVRELVADIPPLPDVRLGQVDNVRLAVAGPVENLSATVSFDLSSIERPEATLSEVHVEARLAGLKTLLIDELTGKVAGGTVAAIGSLEMEGKELKYAVRGALRGIRLTEIHLEDRLGENAPSGTVSADFEASGTGAEPAVHARLDVMEAAWKEWQVTAVQADCTYRDGSVEIHEAQARAPEALITAHGSVNLKGPLDLQVAATGVDLTALAKRLKMEKLQGEAYVRGQVTGTFSEPAFKGELAAYNLAYGEDRLDMLRANVEGDLNQVRIEECRGLYLPAQLGGITATLNDPRAGAEAEIEAVGTVVGIDVTKLSKRFNLKGEWGGTIDVEEVAVTGPLNAIRIEALLTARDLHGAGYSIDYATGRVIAGVDGAVEVSEEEPLTVRTGDSEVKAWGTVSAKRELDLRVATGDGKSIRVEDFQTFDPAVLSLKSSLGLDLHVTGPVDDPKINGGKIRVNELVVNGNAFSRGDGVVHISKGSVRVDRFVLRGKSNDGADRPEQYEVDGTVWPRKDLDVTVGVIAAPIATLMSLGRVPAPSIPINGRITALVKVTEAEPRPLVSVVDLRVTEGAVGPQKIEMLEMKGIDLAQDDLSISSVHLALPEGATLEVAGKASLAPNGPISFKLTGEKLDLALMQPWVSLGKAIGGVGKLQAEVSGTLDDPILDGAVDVDGVQYGDALRLDTVSARLSFRDHVARITDLLVKMDKYQASGYAEVPVDWERKRVAPDAAIRAHVGLDKQSLDVLALFSPRIVDVSEDGYASASLDVAGTLADPKLNGSIEVQCYELVVGNPRPGKDPERALTLRGLDAGIRIEDERIVIDHVNVASAAKPKDLDGVSTVGRILGIFRPSRKQGPAKKGHRDREPLKDPEALQLAGSISLNRFLPDEFDLKLTAKDFAFWERNVTGQFQEEIAFKLNGAVAIKERWPSPMVSGDLELRGARVDVQSYVASKQEPPKREPFAVNPRFAISVKTHEAEVLAARTKAYANVSLDLDGSLNGPEVDGTVKVIRGGVNVSTAYFRIKEGEIVFGMDPRQGVSAAGEILLTTNLRGKNPRTGKEESFAVEAHVVIDMPNIPEEQVQMKFEATPFLERDQIWSLLMRKDVLEGIVAGNTDAGVEDALKREAANLVATALQPRLVEPVERAVAEMLGLNEFSIRASFEEPVEIKVGKYLVKGLRVSYTRAVTAREATYKFKVDYEVMNGVSLSWTTDEKSLRTFGLEAGLQF